MGAYRPDKLQQYALLQRPLCRHAGFPAGHDGNAAQLHTCYPTPGVFHPGNAAAGYTTARNTTARNTASDDPAPFHHTPGYTTAG